MNQKIAHIALLVRDYDEALDFYVNKLGFELIEDTILSDTKRWVMIAPKVEGTCCLLLAKAASDEQKSRIGNQSGGRVAFFLFTDDITRDIRRLRENEIRIIRKLKQEEYGQVMVFADLYGNLWDLIQPTENNKWMHAIGLR